MVCAECGRSLIDDRPCAYCGSDLIAEHGHIPPVVDYRDIRH